MIFSATRRLRQSTRLRALVLLWHSSRALALLAIVFLLLEGALPVLVLIAMGRVTGDIPAAATLGLTSPVGRRLLLALALAGGLYAISLMRGPFEDALAAAATARVDATMQRRVVSAVCTPVGIEHLEDEQVLEQLASARGELLGGQPAGAARARLAGAPLRRSWYLLGLAWKPPGAKEMRVFGLGDWVAERHRTEWLEGIEPAWQELRALNVRTWLAGAVVLAAYGAGAGVLGWTAYHQEITLRTLATMLPMLPATMSTGSITLADISLERSLSALPDLDRLTAELGQGDGEARHGAGSRGRATRSPRPRSAVPRPAFRAGACASSA